MARVIVAMSALAFPALAVGGTTPRVHVLVLHQRVLVSGTSFLPREHLLVRLTGRGVSSKRVVADTEGTFSVSLRRPELRACGRYLLQVRRPAAKPVIVRLVPPFSPPECADLGGALASGSSPAG